MRDEGHIDGVRVALSLLGARVDVVVVGPAGAGDLATTIAAAWARCSAGANPEPAEHVVAVSAADDRDRVMHDLASRLTLTAIRARAGQLWMLHACAVADPRTGASVVLVGPSGAGKTTAAAVLGRHWGYLTDETAAIAPDGSVVTYPKPLSVLVPGCATKRQAGPDELGLIDAPDAPWLAAVALLDRDGSRPPTLEDVGIIEALPALAAQTSALQQLPRPLHLLAGHLHRAGGLRRIRYQEAEDLVPLATGLLAGAR